MGAKKIARFEKLFMEKREHCVTGKRHHYQNLTWYVMTQIPGVLAKKVGNLYENRTWIEYKVIPVL
jgi:hypothetical protein